MGTSSTDWHTTDTRPPEQDQAAAEPSERRQAGRRVGRIVMSGGREGIHLAELLRRAQDRSQGARNGARTLPAAADLAPGDRPAAPGLPARSAALGVPAAVATAVLAVASARRIQRRRQSVR